MSTEEVKPITVKKLPLILNRNLILKKGIKPFSRNIQVLKSLQNNVQEDVIYTSKHGDFTAGEARNLTILNRLNVLTKSCLTIAKGQSHSGEVFEKTSHEITKLIGQNNYDLLFSSLCSIISQELKIRSINSLLTVPKQTRSVSCQTETSVKSFCVKKNAVEISCQTNETCFEDLKKFKPRRRNKRQQLTPYVVKDAPETKKPRRIVISPDNFNTLFPNEESVTKKESHTSETEETLPELGSVFDEDSNNSVGRFSSLSVTTTPDLMANPLNILKNVDKHTRDISNDVNHHEITATEQYRLHNMDSMSDISPSKEKLPFGMKEVLRNIPPDQRIKLLLRQGLNDWKYCLTPDSDGHLPIHVAVLTNDLDLLRRQCLVLKMRDTSVDVPADGLTPLKMSLFQENTQITSVLLDFGADILDSDDEDQTAFHITAEMSTDHLQVLVNHCQQNARKILQDNEDLWKPGYENKPDEELAPILLMHINKLYNSQGYTPLMLASKLGKYNNVLTLVESCRATVNLTMPNSGNTALYLAVGAACMDSAERGNKSKIVDHFSRTIEILVENGADPGIDNFAGSSVNDLLTEFNISELSMLIANKLTSIRYFDGQLPNGIKGSDFMLYKDDSGKVNIKNLQGKDKKAASAKSPPTTTPKTKTSPVILENVTLKPPVNVGSAATAKHNIAVPVLLPNQPVKASTAKPSNSTSTKNDVNTAQSYTPIVKNFKLNQPLVIKSDVTNNKRKLDIVVEPTKNKKPNKND